MGHRILGIVTAFTLATPLEATSQGRSPAATLFTPYMSHNNNFMPIISYACS